MEYPGVQEVAVAGVPHAVLGEDVAAWIVAQPGATIDAETLRAFLAERLSDYKIPAPDSLRHRAAPQRHREGAEARTVCGGVVPAGGRHRPRPAGRAGRLAPGGRSGWRGWAAIRPFL